MSEERPLSEWTEDELVAEQQRFAAEEAACKQAALRIQQVLDYKAAAARVARMSDAEKQAVVQVIQAEGVPSAEAVGTPGAKT